MKESMMGTKLEVTSGAVLDRTAMLLTAFLGAPWGWF